MRGSRISYTSKYIRSSIFNNGCLCFVPREFFVRTPTTAVVSSSVCGMYFEVIDRTGMGWSSVNFAKERRNIM